MQWKVKAVEIDKLDFEQKPLKKNQKPPKLCHYLYICSKTFKNLGDSGVMNEKPIEDDVIE